MTSLLSSCKKLFANHLFAANIGLSFGLSGLGDLIEQRFEKKNHLRTGQINWARTLHMSTAFGLTSGLLCHHWYHYLDRVVPGRGVRVVVQKNSPGPGAVQPCLYNCLPPGGWKVRKADNFSACESDSPDWWETVPGRVGDLAPSPVHQLLLPPHQVQGVV